MPHAFACAVVRSHTFAMRRAYLGIRGFDAVANSCIITELAGIAIIAVAVIAPDTLAVRRADVRVGVGKAATFPIITVSTNIAVLAEAHVLRLAYAMAIAYILFSIIVPIESVALHRDIAPLAEPSSAAFAYARNPCPIIITLRVCDVAK